MKPNKQPQMSRWGIGPLFTGISLIYSLIIFGLSYFYFPLRFTLFREVVNFLVGGILMFIGLLLFFAGAYTLHKKFNSEKLQTKGVYALMRHPIYGSWIVFIIPGIVIISGYVLGLTIPIFMYGTFKRLIRKEETCLQQRFGKEYWKYQQKVRAVFPMISWRRLKKD
ncbi:isoprenylcysteine carboxylmethyltransferase family protein [Candidatus Woesearchaeota archaeon]|nr:isoprenylcysteine carboxylmethyltransferase family protein [Candidatus Woesearchaeota archaeon]